MPAVVSVDRKITQYCNSNHGNSAVALRSRCSCLYVHVHAYRYTMPASCADNLLDCTKCTVQRFKVKHYQQRIPTVTLGIQTVHVMLSIRSVPPVCRLVLRSKFDSREQS